VSEQASKQASKQVVPVVVASLGITDAWNLWTTPALQRVDGVKFLAPFFP